jgi:hypothetical protein
MVQDSAIGEWLAAYGDAVGAGNFVKLGLGKPTPAAGDLKSVEARLITVKRALKLSVTYHHRTRDIVKNYLPAESVALLGELLGEKFGAAKLGTVTADLHLAQTKDGWVLTRHAPTQSTVPELAHDRAKQRFIDSAGKPYLHALGIADAQGKVYKNAQDKFRQINKYIEILDGLVKQLAPRECLRIVDMGAGKGYLTFALYDYLVNSLHMRVEITGVESRADLVEQCNGIARAAEFAGLRFVQGSIADYDCAGADAVIALHACDTATDDAIHKAVTAGAELIVVAPCCHKQIRREMAVATPEHPLGLLLQYGTYVERVAEMVTDGMRAQLLQVAGYKTNLFEFIDGVHTPKNVMIVAVKSAAAPSANASAALQASLAATKAQFGIRQHRLEQLLASE